MAEIDQCSCPERQVTDRVVEIDRYSYLERREIDRVAAIAQATETGQELEIGRFSCQPGRESGHRGDPIIPSTVRQETDHRVGVRRDTVRPVTDHLDFDHHTQDICHTMAMAIGVGIRIGIGAGDTITTTGGVGRQLVQ